MEPHNPEVYQLIKLLMLDGIINKKNLEDFRSSLDFNKNKKYLESATYREAFTASIDWEDELK